MNNLKIKDIYIAIVKYLPVLVTLIAILSTASYASVNYPSAGFTSLEQALLRAATFEADKTVILGAGTFTGNNIAYDIDWPNVSGVRLVGQGMGVSTLDATNTSRFLIIANPVSLSIEALTMKNSYKQNQSGAGIYVSATSGRLNLKNVRISGCNMDYSSSGHTDAYQGAIIYCPNNYITIEADNCIFQGGYADWSDGGFSSGGDLRARNCEFFGNAAMYAGLFYGGKQSLNNCIIRNNSGWVGVIGLGMTTVSTNCVFVNNVYAANDGTPPGNQGALAYNMTGWYSYNSIYYNNHSGSLYTFFTGSGAANNNFKNCTVPSDAGAITKVNCITSNESQFVTFATTADAIFPYDLHLKKSSACIDTGTFEGSLLYAKDGVKRPQPQTNPILNFDMGVYEQARPDIPMVVVLQPNGGESPIGLTTYEVKWQISSTIEPASTAKVRFSADGGSTWLLIRSQTAVLGTNSFVWSVENINSSNCQISVEAKGYGGWNYDASDNPFTIVVTTDTIAPTVNIIKPNGGEKIRGGTIYPVTWFASDETTLKQNLSIEVYYTPMSGWTYISSTREGTTGVGTYEWTVPLITTSMAKIKVLASDEAGNYATDESNATFWIDSTAPAVATTEPHIGDTNNSVNNIKFYFTEPMDAGTVMNNVSIIPDPGTYSYSGTWNTATTELTFDIPLFKGSMYYVTIVSGNDQVGNPMAAPFTLWFGTSADITPPTVEVTYPNGGENLTGGNTIEVTWTATDDSGLAVNGTAIKYSTDSGMNWVFIDDNLPSIGSYEWEVARVNSDHCRVSVEVKDVYNNIGSDMSDTDFIITSESLTVPTIESVYLNNRRFLNKDVVSPSYNLVRVKFIDANDITDAQLTIDGIDTFILNPDAGYPPSEKVWSGPFVMPKKTGILYFDFFVKNDLGFTNNITFEARIVGGRVQVIGTPYNYPNPFKPLGQEKTNIQYTLNIDAPITLMIFDITGKEVKRLVFPSGKNGGMAGSNTVNWDGRSLFNEVSGDGMYIYKITSKGTVIGSGKITVRD